MTLLSLSCTFAIVKEELRNKVELIMILASDHYEWVNIIYYDILKRKTLISLFQLLLQQLLLLFNSSTLQRKA